jgi:adenosylcobinamide-phosphate synthase
MIGHRTKRHAAFGFAAAKFDDLVNLVPARLAALWICLAALGTGRPGAAPPARDARGHPSPNAGWPEAAMAGALGLARAGQRTYHGEIVNDPWLGDGRARATTADIGRALRLYVIACLLQATLVLGAYLAVETPGF